MAKPKEKTQIQTLVESIREDQALLIEKDELLIQAKEDRKEVHDRLKEHQQDANVLYKYATEQEKALLETLQIDSPSSRARNDIAEMALRIMEDNKEMTNEALYNEYIDTVPKDIDAATYTEFNIKIRTLFNSKLLTRVKDEESNSSRDDLISLNENE